MTDPLLEGHQAAQAPDVTRRKAALTVPGLDLVSKKIKGIVVTPDYYDRFRYFIFSLYQLGMDRLFFLYSFHVARYPYDSVCLRNGRNRTGAPWERSRDDRVIDLAEFYAHEFFESQPGRDLFRNPCLYGLSNRLSCPEHAAYKRPDKLLKRNDGGNRIPRYPYYRFILYDAEYCGFAGHHCHSVHQYLSKLADHLCGIVFRACGRPGDKENNMVFSRNGICKAFQDFPVRIRQNGMVCRPSSACLDQPSKDR